MSTARAITLILRCDNCGWRFTAGSYREYCGDCEPEYAPPLLTLLLVVLAAWGFWSAAWWAWRLV